MNKKIFKIIVILGSILLVGCTIFIARDYINLFRYKRWSSSRGPNYDFVIKYYNASDRDLIEDEISELISVLGLSHNLGDIAFEQLIKHGYQNSVVNRLDEYCHNEINNQDYRCQIYSCFILFRLGYEPDEIFNKFIIELSNPEFKQKDIILELFLSKLEVDLDNQYAKLLAQFLTDPDIEVSGKILMVLSKFKEIEIIEYLKLAANSNHSRLRKYAAFAIGTYAENRPHNLGELYELSEILNELLNDNEIDVRLQACNSAVNYINYIKIRASLYNIIWSRSQNKAIKRVAIKLISQLQQ